MKQASFARWLAALGLGLVLVGAPTLASAAPTMAPPTSVTAEGVRPALDAHARQHDYAAREAANPRAADFKGTGAGIYIGGSTVAVVLIIVLILVLL